MATIHAENLTITDTRTNNVYVLDKTKLTNSAVSTDTATALVPASLNNFAQDMISGVSAYSKNATYEIGNRVRQNTKTWECIVPISTPEEWTVDHWKALDPIQTQLDNVFTLSLAELRAK